MFWCYTKFTCADVTVMLDSQNLTVIEGESVHVCAKLLGRADFPISISFQPTSSLNNTAQETADYDSTEKSVEFPAHSSQRQCVDIQITDNDLVEREETFEVVLTLREVADERVRLAPNSSATVTITDDDGKSGHQVYDHHLTLLLLPQLWRSDLKHLLIRLLRDREM